MHISQHDSLLPRINTARRNMFEAPERTNKYENSQLIVINRNYPTQRSYLHTSPANADTNVYNTTKVELLRKNPMGMFIDIHA